MAATVTLFLYHKSGALHQLTGRNAAKLKRELKAGRGGPEITALIEYGYTGYMSRDKENYPLDNLTDHEEIR
jgi:hypothetical protein